MYMNQPGSVRDGTLGALMRQPGAINEGTLGALMRQPGSVNEGSLGILMPQPRAVRDGSLGILARPGRTMEHIQRRRYPRPGSWAPLWPFHGVGATPQAVASRMATATNRGLCLQGCQKQPKRSFGGCVSRCTSAYPLRGLGEIAVTSWAWLAGGAALLGAVVVMARRR